MRSVVHTACDHTAKEHRHYLHWDHKYPTYCSRIIILRLTRQVSIIVRCRRRQRMPTMGGLIIFRPSITFATWVSRGAGHYLRMGRWRRYMRRRNTTRTLPGLRSSSMQFTRGRMHRSAVNRIVERLSMYERLDCCDWGHGRLRRGCHRLRGRSLWWRLKLT